MLTLSIRMVSPQAKASADQGQAPYMPSKHLVLSTANLALSRVEEAVLQAPISLLAGSARHLKPDDDQLLQLVFQTWVLSLDGLRVVIDPCNGNGRHRPGMPHFDSLNAPFLERFTETGISPEEVDFVFCTHLHCDHCGWNTHLRDGRWVPTFPNARYLMARKEVDRWGVGRNDHPQVDYNVTVFEESVQPIIDAGLAEIIDGTHDVRPGVTIEPAFGHTAGHSILRVERGNDLIYFTGDAFHHPLQVEDPSLHLPGCDNLAAAVATRNALRERIAEEEALMAPAHFIAPHIGRIRRSFDVFNYSPAMGS